MAALGTIGTIARIMKARASDRLRRLGKMEGPKAQAAGLKMLEGAMEAGRNARVRPRP